MGRTRQYMQQEWHVEFKDGRFETIKTPVGYNSAQALEHAGLMLRDLQKIASGRVVRSEA